MGSTGEVPTYLLSTEQAPLVEEEEQDEGGLEDILQVFKIFKLARVLKLARHSPGLQVYIYHNLLEYSHIENPFCKNLKLDKISVTSHYVV